MNKYKLQILLLIFVLQHSLSYAQEFFLRTDFVSSYIWRGMKLGEISIQPEVGVTWGGFSFSMWGSTDFHKDTNEIDLFLEYEYESFRIGLVDYFEQDGERPRYFNYNPHSTHHTFEAQLGYIISESLPLSIGWYTVFAGNDFKDNDKRAYSSYLEIGYPFTFKGFDLEVELGITPWEGMYADKFNVTNIGLTVGRAIPVTRSFSLPIWGKIIVNPAENNAYFVFGLTL